MNSEPTMQKCVIEETQTFSLISKKAYNGRISKVLQKVVWEEKRLLPINLLLWNGLEVSSGKTLLLTRHEHWPLVSPPQNEGTDTD